MPPVHLCYGKYYFLTDRICLKIYNKFIYEIRLLLKMFDLPFYFVQQTWPMQSCRVLVMDERNTELCL